MQFIFSKSLNSLSRSKLLILEALFTPADLQVYYGEKIIFQCKRIYVLVPYGQRATHVGFYRWRTSFPLSPSCPIILPLNTTLFIFQIEVGNG